MTFGVPAKVIAASFALAAFAVAVIAGLASGNPTRAILTDAILAMLACHLAGLFIGALMQRVINEHLDGYRAATPVPEIELPVADGDAPAEARGG